MIVLNRSNYLIQSTCTHRILSYHLIYVPWLFTLSIQTFKSRAVDTLDHALDTLDHAGEPLDHAVDTLDPEMDTLDHEVDTLAPTKVTEQGGTDPPRPESESDS